MTGFPTLSALPARVHARARDLWTESRRAWFLNPQNLVFAFLAVHAVFFMSLLPAILTGQTLGDLPLYRTWAEHSRQLAEMPGISGPWVYPFGALLPILLSNLLGPYHFQLVWFLLTLVLNAIAVAALSSFGRNRNGIKAAWWFLAVTLVLSPVALLRLEGIVAPLVVVALVILGRQPALAAVMLALGAWIKVWPAAVLLAIVIASRRRLTVALSAAGLSIAVIATMIALGGARNIFSFITAQSDRALQLEAPITTFWVWAAAFRLPDNAIYHNVPLATEEVTGPGADFAATLMTPLMFVAIAALCAVLIIAMLKGADSGRLVLLGSLTMVTALIAFNKVGSPQYILWLTPIVAVGLVSDWRAWRPAAVLLLPIALLTSLVFPVFYLPLIDRNIFAVILLTARNGMIIWLLVWATRQLVQLMRSAGPLQLPASVASPLARAKRRRAPAGHPQPAEVLADESRHR